MKKYIYSFLLLLIVSLGYGQDTSLKAAPPGGGGGGDRPVKMYRDGDGDGFGDPTKSIMSSEAIEGYVSQGNDLDDNNRFITNRPPTQYFYEDIDGDTYGNPNSSVFYTLKPPGYVTNNQDCNDREKLVNPDTVWYFDGDHDSFGNRSITTTSCLQPTDYVANPWDLDDGNGAITNITPQTFYRDFDTDTYGSAIETIYCSVMPEGYVTNNQDCNDRAILINPKTVWYFDGDHDGFGNRAVTVASCTQPTDYVDNANDCNDAATDLNPDTVWYYDNDDDGSGNDNITFRGCAAPKNYVRRAGDCDDNNPEIDKYTRWYLDGDGDGFGVAANFVLNCTKPEGYADKFGDCDDGNKFVNPDTIWYYDNDGDGAGDASVFIQSCTKPDRYVQNSDDCADGNPAYKYARTWYYDKDGDGFGRSTTTLEKCIPPYGYVDNASDYDDESGCITNIPPQTFYEDFDKDTFGNPSVSISCSLQPVGYVTNNSDYDDRTGNITNIPPQTFYEDFDTDTFGNPNVSLYYSIQPVGYVSNNSDYDDRTGNIINIAPQTFYEDFDKDTFGNANVSLYYSIQPVGYVNNNSDYDDRTEFITNIPPQTFYEDFDKDTFGNPNVSVYRSLQPTGYVNNNSDYDDRTEFITNIPPQTFYEDFDKDTYGNPNVSLYYSIQPTGYVANASDCDDRATLINPNTKWYADNEGDGLGDPSNFVQQCTKPAGNYVDNYSDNCPLLYGSDSDCSSIKNPSSDHNYVITTNYKEPVKTVLANPSPNQAQTSITYFDGLGRPIQQIANQQSNSGKDIITHIGYDDFGRQTQEYLPYAATSVNMAYEANADVNTINFYSTEKYENTANPFSEKELESSPLSRVLKQAAPGTDWAMGGGHEIKLDYQTNSGSEVKSFKAATSWNASEGIFDIVLSDNGYYEANELFKTVTYDENSSSNPSETSGSTVEFKDKEGKVILKRTYESQQKHDTYYVYDDYGNLTYVIPPKADGAISDEVLNGLCYQYKYDYRNRLAEKKLPGKQWEFIVYDRLGRPVAIGPANSPFKGEKTIGWLITKYDAFSRPVYTGWLNSTSNTSSRKTMQDAQNAVTAATALFETKQTSGTIDGVAVNYSNLIEPTSFKLLTVNYYDNYEYPNVSTVATSIEGQDVLANTKGLATGSWVRVLSSAFVISGETTSLFYDDKARAIRSYSQNYLGGNTSTDNKLDFAGKPEYTITKHKRTTGDVELTIREEFTYSAQDRLLTHTHQINGGAVQLLAENIYDDLGQLNAKKVGESTGNPLQKVNYSYNIRGWLTGINKTDNLQQDTDPKDLFAFKINYNKVDWDAGAAQKLYNGNIAETSWITGNDITGVTRGYGYKYDQLNRLKDATYQTPNLTDNKNYFGENLDYDKNGNIIRLQRKFMAGVSSNPYAGDMDNLGYFYTDNSNQLMKVSDTSNSPQGFKDDSNGYDDNSDDYSYDANGNLITDENKNITEIHYNHLNLPTQITFGTGNSIAYIYNAAGQKLEKIVTEGTTTTYTNYLGGFQYNYRENQDGGDLPVPEDPQGPKDPPIDGTDPPPIENNRNSALRGQSINQEVPSTPTLQFFPTAEGYVNNTFVNGTNSYNYVFNYTDHLGNVRVSYKKNAAKVLEILEENNYYPFGLKHQGYNTDNNQPNFKIKYNGKEFQDELGFGMYDYGFRNYDPAIGRWMNIDPLAETSRRFSPFAYALNNPVFFIDPDGMEAQGHNGRKNDQTEAELNASNKSFVQWVNNGGNNDIDPSKKGAGTDTGNAQYNGADGLPNGVDRPAEELNEVVVNGKGESITSSLAGGWAIAIGEPTPAGEIIMGVATLCMVIYYAPEITKKASEEIVGIMDRLKGPNGVQYSLRATVSGDYPIYSFGSKIPTGYRYLEAGAVWKYGETINPNSRYSETFKNGMQVRQVDEFRGSQISIKIAEKSKIYNYFFANGQLPAGNKIFR
ncbi:DUF6443 domain-containing protein [Flavobacterium sp. PL02]|uniref:DUF6443 domain-containing protein n=1 Tax=Flavobacterium sp. PL02 TaxID=3088354 RepID=UPI002B2226BE|nr:DUF6443 domain-containing protein [Flavobacterium sp. PL02]MEA9414291.1 DUF6443 domain-containing protein [Flavobacterium sp. PL02]